MEERHEDINIVLLGETGVGKSTFINSFCNYLMYESFESAVSSEFVYVPVCSKFNVLTSIDSDDESLVEVGIAENIYEKYKQGDPHSSATDMPMSHVIDGDNGKYKINIIDTPGINSTDTNDQEENVEDGADEKVVNVILNHISHYNHISAFVVLLKPGQERQNKSFSCTVKKILSKLDPSAKNNIVFAITHAMGCFFQDTTTLPNLRKFFKQEKLDIKLDRRDNVFHFEGHPFKYLATKCTPNKPIQDYVLVENCWNKSVDNCKNMIRYISSLRPHSTIIMNSVNKTKRMTKQAIKPLLRIYRVNDENISRLREAYDKLADERGAKLIPVKGKYLTYRKLDKPYTVCTNDACYIEEEFTEFNEKGKKVRGNIYNQVCCHDCRVPMFSHDLVGSTWLWFCRSINWIGKCKRCDHWRSEHVHIAYELNKAEEIFEMGTKEIAAKKKELEQELETIENALIFFSRFLDHHSFQIDRGFVNKVFKKELKKSEEQLLCNAISKIEVQDKFQKFAEDMRSTDEKDQNELSLAVKGLKGLLTKITPKDAGEDGIDLSTKQCDMIMESLFEMNLHGGEFKKVYKDIEDDFRNERYFFRKIYRLGEGSNIPKDKFFKHACEV